MNIIPAYRLISVFAISLVGLLAVPSCQQESQVPMDPTAAQQLCRQLWTNYLDAIKTLQPEKIAGYFTKDAALIYPDMLELRSRESIQAHLVKGFANLKKIEFTFTLDHFDVVRSKAYTFVTLDEIVEEDSQPPAHQQARCGVVWQQQADKSWQISHFLVNYLSL